MSRKERTLSVLKGLAMLAGGIFLLILENMWFQEQQRGAAGSIRFEGILVVTGLALVVLGAAFLRDGCRRKKICTKRNDINSMPLLRRQCAGQRAKLPNLRKEYV